MSNLRNNPVICHTIFLEALSHVSKLYVTCQIQEMTNHHVAVSVIRAKGHKQTPLLSSVADKAWQDVNNGGRGNRKA